MVANRRPWGSVLLAGIGAVALGVGLVSEHSFLALGTRVAPLPLAGALAVGAGIVGVALRRRPAPEPVPSVPAHVAFSAPAKRAAIPAPAPPAGPRAAAAAPVALDPRLASIDDEVRELSRQISRAGVMLATGRISQEGYRQYVEELKNRKGRLEASRVTIELARPDDRAPTAA